MEPIKKMQEIFKVYAGREPKHTILETKDYNWVQYQWGDELPVSTVSIICHALSMNALFYDGDIQNLNAWVYRSVSLYNFVIGGSTHAAKTPHAEFMRVKERFSMQVS